MSQRRQRLYRRLDRAERAAIERGLDKNRPARAMARDLGRSPVERRRRGQAQPHRHARAGQGVEGRVGARGRLRQAPRLAARLQRLQQAPLPLLDAVPLRVLRGPRPAAGRRRAVRRQARGDRTEEEFESIAAKIRADLARGLSPAQIADARSSEFRAAPSTIYRWIERGYAGMSNMDLRRKVGYRPRRRAAPAPTPHGPERSFSAFSALPEGEREAACEMDTVIGRAADRQCVLTLHLRCCRAQLCLLLPERSSSAVAAALDVLEAAVGKRAFQRMFGLILTDNGAEFSDWESLERSCLPGKGARCRVYYCDVRQSQQKGGCERNHVELRKLLPKRRGISFDDLEAADMAAVMSQLNPEPRPSMAFMPPLRALLAAYGDDGAALTAALGVEEVPYGELLLGVEAVNRARLERGADPLI